MGKIINGFWNYNCCKVNLNVCSNCAKSRYKHLVSYIKEKLFSVIIISIFFISFFGFILFLFKPKETEMYVSEVSWEYCINIDKYTTVSESDWHLPAGARLLYTREEYYDTKEVIDHYEVKNTIPNENSLNLDGRYFKGAKEDYTEPVYKEVYIFKRKYYYEIERWKFERIIRTFGNDKNPYWGEVVLSDDERISSKNTSYYITCHSKREKDIIISLSYDDWMKIEVDKKVKLHVILGHGEIVE